MFASGKDRGGAGAVAAPGGCHPVRRLSAEDLSILALENQTVAGHSCKVIVLRDPIDTAELRSSIAARLHRAPEFRLRLGEAGGEPWWLSDERLDLAAHVAECRPGPADLAGPVAGGGPGPAAAAGLRAMVAALFQQRLDRGRPLWHMDVVPQLNGGGSAVIWRVHHAVADGFTAMRMASAVLWDDESPPGSSAATAAPPRGAARGRAAGHRLGTLMAAAREAPQPWLRSPFSGHIGARRTVAFASAGLGGLHRAAHAVDGATVNDAVLTVVAGGMRRWLERRHGRLGAVRVKVPVSLHGAPPAAGAGDAGPGNRDSYFCLDLPLGPADPVERLAAIRRATRARKDGHDAQHLDALMRQLGRTPRLREFAGRVLAHPRSFALNVSNVPGPSRPVRVLGVPVRALYSLAEIRDQHALRVAVVSLAGTLNFGLVADPTLLDGVEQLAADMQAEAAALTGGPLHPA